MSLPEVLDAPRTKALFADIDTVLCDCDGVLYLENMPIDGAVETVNFLRQFGKKVIYASNNATQSRQTIIAKLNRLGFGAQMEDIVTGAFLTSVYLRHRQFKGRAYILGCQGIK